MALGYFKTVFNFIVESYIPIFMAKHGDKYFVIGDDDLIDNDILSNLVSYSYNIQPKKSIYIMTQK